MKNKRDLELDTTLYSGCQKCLEVFFFTVPSPGHFLCFYSKRFWDIWKITIGAIFHINNQNFEVAPNWFYKLTKIAPKNVYWLEYFHHWFLVIFADHNTWVLIVMKCIVYKIGYNLCKLRVKAILFSTYSSNLKILDKKEENHKNLHVLRIKRTF